MVISLLYPHMAEKDQHYDVSSYKDTTSMHEGTLPHELLTSQMPYLQIPSPWELRFNILLWRVTNIQSIALGIYFSSFNFMSLNNIYNITSVVNNIDHVYLIPTDTCGKAILHGMSARLRFSSRTFTSNQLMKLE